MSIPDRWMDGWMDGWMNEGTVESREQILATAGRV